MRIAAQPEEDGRAALIAALAVGAAMVLGGGGSPAPLAEMAVQMIVGVLFCLWLIWCADLPGGQLRSGLVLSALLLVLPVVQLIPLPPTLWHALPGRAVERGALDLIGAADTWRPFSMAPARTLAALLALVPPAIVLLMTATLGPAGRTMVIGMIAGITGLAIVVGAAQTAGGVSNPLRFYVPDAGYLNGFQANHNSAADVLLIGMVAYAALVQEWVERRRRWSRGRGHGRGPAAAVLTGVALLSLGVFLTGSRAGTALLPVAWAGVYAATRPQWRTTPRRLALIAVGALVALVAIAWLLRGNAVVGGVLDRYNFGSELRPRIWIDSLFAAQSYFPVGAGLGAFVPVFVSAERLEAVHPGLPNRAHNDYLELAVEGGALGFLLLGIMAAMLARFAVKQLRDPSPQVRRHAIFAATTFTIVALHSQVDYPLRSMSLACIAAASAGLLVPVARGPRGTDVPVEI